MEWGVSQTILGFIGGKILFPSYGLFLIPLECILQTWGSDTYLDYKAHIFIYKIVNTSFQTWTQS